MLSAECWLLVAGSGSWQLVAGTEPAEGHRVCFYGRSWLKPSATSSWRGWASGASPASTAIPATASTASSARSSAPKTRIEFIQVRHEEMAAFMACAHAKFTGEVGVCLATSGPGAIHLLNGLYDAKTGPSAGGRDRRPGGARRAGRQLPAGGGPAVAVQGRRAANTCTVARCPAQIRHLIDRAMRIAHRRAHRHLHHRPERPAGAGRRRGAAARARRRCTPASAVSAPRVVPRDEDLQRAADVLNAGSEGRDAGRRRRARRDRRGDRGRRRCSAPASPRRCSARRRCPTICRSSPARSACSAREPS